jgi:hypothetical protein
MWWSYIKNVIRAYPELKREYDSLHHQSVTANLSGMPGGGQVSRGTESIAIRELPGEKQREYDSVRQAINATRRMHNGNFRMRIIELVYWSRGNRMTVEGAAMRVGYSADRGKQIHGDFVRLVAKYYGYKVDKVDYHETEKLKKS